MVTPNAGGCSGTWMCRSDIAKRRRGLWRKPRFSPKAKKSRQDARSSSSLITQRLAGLQHVCDALLRLRHLRQCHEMLALQAQQPVLVDQRATVHLATA